jgi:hypothetical protein
MITIFAVFNRVSENKLAFFHKYQCDDQFFGNKLATAWTKNAYIFVKLSAENIFKIISAVPGSNPASSGLKADAITTLPRRQRSAFWTNFLALRKIRAYVKIPSLRQGGTWLNSRLQKSSYQAFL